MISDVLKITHLFKTKGLLSTVNIEKSFNSDDDNFLINSLETFGSVKKLV